MKKRIFSVLLSVIMCIPSFMPVFADSVDPMADYTIVDSDKHPENDLIVAYYCDKNGDTNDAALFVSQDGGTTKTLVREFKHEKEEKANDGLVKFDKQNTETGIYPLLIVLKDEEAYTQTGEGMGLYASDDLGETIKCIGFKGGLVSKITMGQDRVLISAAVDSLRNETTGELESTNGTVYVSYDSGISWRDVRDAAKVEASGTEEVTKTIPASEYEHLTHTKYNKYIDIYNMTLEETLDAGLHGGEGFQIIFSQQMCNENANYVARGYDTSGLHYSKDGGENWYPEEMPLDENYSAGIGDIEYYPDDPEIVFSYRDGFEAYGPTSGIYISRNGGMSSKMIYNFSHKKEARGRDGLIKFGYYDEAKKEYPMFTIIKDEVAYDRGNQPLGIYRSYDYRRDDGVAPTFECIGFEDKKVANIEVSPDKKILIATIESEKNTTTGKWENAKDNIYVSYDNGDSWEKRTGGIEHFTATTIGVDTLNYSHWITAPYYEYGEDGFPDLYETFDEGKTWTNMNVENWNGEHESGKNVNMLKNSGYLREIMFGKPLKQLIRYQKTSLINPNEIENITLEFSINEMASYDDNETFSYILEKGEYTIFVGDNVRDAKEVLKLDIEEKTVENLRQNLAPVYQFDRIKPVINGDKSEISYEPITTRKYDINERIKEHITPQIPPKNMGITLKDVAEGKATLDEFVLQLSKEELTYLGFKRGADGRFALDDTTSSIALEIFQRVANLEPFVDIYTDLNCRGIKTTSGKEWNKSSFRRMLTNERYRGVYIWKDTRIEGGVPRIVSDELYFKVQEVLKTKKNAQGRHRIFGDYLLTGKLFCGYCEEPMVGYSGTSKSGTLHHYYVCNTRRLKHTCEKENVRREYIELQVAQAIQQYALQPDVIEWIANRTVEYNKRQEEASHVAILEEQLNNTQKSIKNIMSAIEQGIFTDSTKSRLLELETEQTDIKKKISLAKADIITISKEDIIAGLSIFKNGNINDKRYCAKLFDAFLVAVYLYDDHIKIVFTFTGNNNTIDISLELLEENSSDFVDMAECSYIFSNGSPKHANTNFIYCKECICN